MLSNHLILCHPLLLPPSIFPSIRVFSNESVLIRWPKYWSFSFSIGPSNEYSGLISFRMDWLDLPAVQGTLKSLLQHHSWKASTLQCSAFSMVQLSHPYMTTGSHFSRVQLFATLWSVARQAPLPMGLSRGILEWVATPSSRGSSPSRNQTHVSYVSCIGRRVLYLGSPK